jgi:hypothetical protein
MNNLWGGTKGHGLHQTPNTVDLALTNDSFLNHSSLWWSKSQDFPPHSIFTLIDWPSIEKKSSSFATENIILIWTCGFLFYLLGYNPLLSNCPRFSQWEPL